MTTNIPSKPVKSVAFKTMHYVVRKGSSAWYVATLLIGIYTLCVTYCCATQPGIGISGEPLRRFRVLAPLIYVKAITFDDA